MEQAIPQRQIDAIVHKLHVLLKQDLKKMHDDEQLPELISTSMAAKMLGMTPQSLRQICCEDPQRYPHIKRGTSKQAKLMFDRKALIKIINGMC